MVYPTNVNDEHMMRAFLTEAPILSSKNPPAMVPQIPVRTVTAPKFRSVVSPETLNT